MKIYAPNGTNLSMVDLPGLTMVACTDRGQPKDMKERVRKLVKDYIQEENTIILSTAHPSKFSDVVMKETGIKPELPTDLKNILFEKEKYDKLPNDLKKIQDYILERV